MRDIINVILSAIIFGCLLFSCATLPPAENGSDTLLPVNKSTYHVGHLPNGMTYYLVHSENPANKADFKLVVKAGALHEKRKEAGAAHFTEHIVLTETNHNKPGYLESFCERRGISQEDINGVTNSLYTEYMMQNIDVTNGQNIDSCLQLMYEWTHSVPFNTKTVEYNRGLICSEIALRSFEPKTPQNLMYKMLCKELSWRDSPSMGEIHSIKKLKPKNAKSFYDRMYVPENQAIIVSGDIDKTEVENKIKAILGSIPTHQQDKKRIEGLTNLSKRSKVRTSVLATTEVPETKISLGFLTDKGYNKRRDSEEFYINGYYNELILGILYSRFIQFNKANKDKKQTIVPAKSELDRFGNVLENPYLGISFKSNNGEWKDGMKFMVHTLKDIYLHGFRQGEFFYNKQELTNGVLSMRADTLYTNDIFVRMLEEHFLYGEDLTTNYRAFTPVINALDSLKKEDLDNFFRNIIDNRKPWIAAVMNTDTPDGVPTERELKNLFETYWNEDCTLPQIETAPEEEIAVNCEIAPHTTHIVNKEESPMGYNVITLSNNIKLVVWQKTNSPSIYIKGLLPTPFGSNADDWQDVLPYIAKDYPNYMGYGGLNATQIKKWHNKEEWSRDRRIEQKCYVTENSLSVQGKCDYKTFEEYLKSLYLSLTQVSRDSVLLADRKRYCVKESQTSNNAVNSVFNKVVREAKYPHLRGVETGQSHRIAEAFQAATSNFDGLRLFMVGNFFGNNVDSLITHYLGALPTKPKESAKEATAALPICQLDTVIKQALPADVAVTFCQYFCDSVPYTGSNHFISELADLVLKDVLNKTMREKLGLLYHPMCEVRLSHTAPMAQLNFWMTTYQQDVSKTIKSLDSLLKCVDQWQIDTNIIRQYKQGLQDNLPFWKQSGEWWCNRFYLASLTGVDADANMLQTIEPITEQEVRNFIKSIVSTDKVIRLTLTKNGKRK